MPSNLHELRSLLGTFGFWRSYIKNYATIVYPLTLLTRKGVVWRWGEPEQASLDTLKRAVIDSPVLLSPDCNKPFIIVTDASDYAIGASLEQCDAEDNRRPVTYFSHQLNPAKLNYPVHERDLRAIVIALRTWRHMLLGSTFTVECQTDHRPLQSICHRLHCPLAKCDGSKNFLSITYAYLTYLVKLMTLRTDCQECGYDWLLLCHLSSHGCLVSTKPLSSMPMLSNFARKH